MDVQVAALRHAVKEGAQRCTVIAQFVEPCGGDYCGKVTGNNDETRNENGGRYQNDGNDDATLQGGPHRAVLARAEA